MDAIHLLKAKASDADTLVRVSQCAFDHDVHYGAPGLGGPPECGLPAWQAKMMRLDDYYKMVVDNQTVGGIIIFRKSTQNSHKDRHKIGEHS